jgi:hypothetical protein
MTSKLLKAAALSTAALCLGALASPAAAKTLTFTFGNASGGSYCDGVTLTQATTGHPTWGGTHTGCTNNDPAGGYDVKVNGGPNLDIATTFSSDGDTDAFTFFLNLKQQYWYLYRTTSGVFAQINAGPLIKGAPVEAPKGSHPVSSLHTNPVAQRDQMF